MWSLLAYTLEDMKVVDARSVAAVTITIANIVGLPVLMHMYSAY